MSSRQGPAGDRQVFRSTASLVLWWVWLAMAVIILADLAVQGRDHTAAVMAALVAVITGVAYACALRPRIIADRGGITVANPLRDHRVPWASVVKVDLVYAVRVHCAAAPGARRGKVVHSWAVQSTARSTRNAQLRARRASRRPRLQGLPAGLGRAGYGAYRPGYGAHPEEVQKALDRTPAEFAAHELDQRAQQARAETAAASGPEVHWAWGAIAAIVLPVVVLVVVTVV